MALSLTKLRDVGEAPDRQQLAGVVGPEEHGVDCLDIGLGKVVADDPLLVGVHLDERLDLLLCSQEMVSPGNLYRATLVPTSFLQLR